MEEAEFTEHSAEIMAKAIENVKGIRLAIIGVGLIGGSLGLALKARLGDDIYITGMCRTEASMKKAVEMGAVDFASADPEEVVKDADIIFLSTPVLQMMPMTEKLLPFIKKGAIITDAGSTKQYIWNELKKILPPDIYYIADSHGSASRSSSWQLSPYASILPQGYPYGYTYRA